MYTQQTIDGDYMFIGSTESYGAGESDYLLVKVESDQLEKPN